MSRLGTIVVASLGFGAGFALLFLAQFVLSPVSRSIWLVPGLILIVVMLLGALPSYRPVEARLSVFFAYGSAFGIAHIVSLPPPAIGSAAERISVAAVPMLMVTLTLPLAFIIGSWRSHRSASWLTAGLLLGLLVAYFSGISGGTGGGAWERWLVEVLGLSAGTAEILVITLRKTIHFTFYGILAAAFLRAARAEKVPYSEAVLFAMVLAAAFAGFDELRQTTTAGRTGSALDFLIDLAGAMSFVWFLRRRGQAKSSIRSAKP